MMLDWRNFVLRSDIKNLPLEEQRRRFLKEQLEHDNLLTEHQQRQYNFYMSQMQSKGGAPGGGGFSGIGIDGPIAGATVVSNVGTTTTNAQGEFSFSLTPTGLIKLRGGVDAITGVENEGEYIGFSQFKVVSPITTFAHHLRLASIEDKEASNLTIDQAITQTFERSSIYFGIDLPVEKKNDVLNKDFIREAIENNNPIGIAAQAVSTQLESITETVGVALENSDQQKELTKKFGDGAKIPQFSRLNRKTTAYEALGRSLFRNNNSNVNIDNVLENIKYVNPLDNVQNQGIKIQNQDAIKGNLDLVINDTKDLATKEHLDTNYLTTQIQSLNRVQKTRIKGQVSQIINNERDAFDNVQELANETSEKNKLGRISRDKPNEVTEKAKNEGIRGVFNFAPFPGTQTFTQQRFDKIKKQFVDVTLSFEHKNTGDLFYYGNIKNSPRLLNKENQICGFPSYPDQSLAPKSETGIFSGLPVTHTIVRDFDGIITTQTATFRPFLIDPKKENSEVGLRIISTSTSTALKPNTADHIVDTKIGRYSGIILIGEIGGKGNKGEIQISIISDGKEELSTLSLGIILGEEDKETPDLILQPGKGRGLFELLDNNSKEIVATNLKFEGDVIRNVKWNNGKDKEFDLSIGFSKKAESTLHISKAGTYTLSRNTIGAPIPVIMLNAENGDGGRKLRAEFDKDIIDMFPSDPKENPNGPFTIRVTDNEDNVTVIKTNIQIGDDGTVQFTYSKKLGTYTIQYKA